jgi:hypothetical protein
VLEFREQLSENAFVEAVIWELPAPVRGSTHSYKYRLAHVVGDVCVMRYDNEAGKGDHRHIGAAELGYTFTTVDALLADFWSDVGRGSKKETARWTRRC